MHSRLFSFVVGLSLLALVSCGPMYQTRRNYFPPKETGMRCVSQCLKNKSTCTSECSRQKGFCNTINSVKNAYSSNRNNNCQEEVQESTSSTGVKTTIKKSNCADRNPSLSNSSYECTSEFNSCNNSCLDSYDSCYMSCGGRVEYTQVCVAFCDKK